MKEKNTTLYAVCGKPVAHSKSPLMMNAAFEALNINAVYVRLAAESGAEAIATMKRYDIVGMNITAPHKEEVAELANIRAESVRSIQGTNTIFLQNKETIAAYNTDYQGVVGALKQCNISLKGKKTLIIGTGGAGRAAAFGLAAEECALTVINRTYQKALDIAQSLNATAADWSTLAAVVQQNEIIIVTISTAVPVLRVEMLNSKHIVLDANYQYTALETIVTSAGATFLSGRWWLWQQAVPALEIFVNQKCNEKLNKIMWKALDSPVKILSNKPIALIGFPGSGKSTNGKLLATLLGYEFIDLDEWLVAHVGSSIAEVFANKGEAFFRNTEREILEKALQKRTAVISCGGGVTTQSTNRVLLKEKSWCVWLLVQPESALERITDDSRPLLLAKDRLQRAKELYEERLYGYASVSDLVIDTENKTFSQIVKQLYEEIHCTFVREGYNLRADL